MSLDHPTDHPVELIESASLRRVWRVTGAIEATIEWSLDHDGWRRITGSERVLVDGVVVWKDLAVTHGLVAYADFVVATSVGLVPLRVERAIRRGTLLALRLSIDGTPIYIEGDRDWLSSGPPELPVPASSPDSHGRELPRPSEASSTGRDELQTPTGGSRRQRLRALRWALILAMLALTATPVVMGYFEFKKAYGDPALVAAASSGDAARVRTLLERGSPANSFHLEGSSALWWAVSSGSAETVQLLLDHGADPNCPGQWSTVIEQAIQNLELEDGQSSLAVPRTLLVRSRQFKDPEQVKLLREAVAKKQTAPSKPPGVRAPRPLAGRKGP